MSDSVDLKEILGGGKKAERDEEIRKQRTSVETMAGSHTLPSESAYISELGETDGYNMQGGMFGDSGDLSFVQDQLYTRKRKDQQQKLSEDMELQNFHAMQMKTLPLDAPPPVKSPRDNEADTSKPAVVQPKFVLKKRGSGESGKKSKKTAKRAKKAGNKLPPVSAKPNAPTPKAPSALEGLVAGLVGYGSSDDDSE
jgi:hypothetical protein